jgi:aminodeoxyfutalosine deaminase
VNQPPIENGAVVVFGDRIVAVDSWGNIRAHHAGDAIDLGESVLLPGLVNAHCHLDYTHMSGLLPPQRSFCDWIKLITTEKAHWTYSDYAESWIDGARMLLHSGTTTVGDIEASPELLPDVWNSTPLRIISFLEMTGVRSRRNPKTILDDALATISPLPRDRCSAALSPHAPYSTTPDLLKASASVSRQNRWPMSVHVAESLTEFDMFMHGHGEMFEWLRRNERNVSDCGDVSPVQHMARHDALDSNLLAIHVNYLADGDAELLASAKASVVHCPRSRDYFAHSEFPHAKLDRVGVNICLGTDSLATVRKRPHQIVHLNMFDEMRAFAALHFNIAPEKILRLATVNGARALGLTGQVGELRENACADLIVLPFAGDIGDVFDAVLHHPGDVPGSMIAGEWAITPRL